MKKYLMIFCLAILQAKIKFTLNDLPDDIEENIVFMLNHKVHKLSKIGKANSLDLFLHDLANEITKATSPFGYYKPTISFKSEEKHSDYSVNINVQLNEPAIIKTLKLQSEGDMIPLAVLNDIPLKKGSVFINDNLTQAKTLIQSYFTANGYINGTFTESIAAVNTNTNQVDIVLTFDPKVQYVFGHTHLHNVDFIDEKLMLNHFQFHQNDPYSSEKITDTSAVLTKNNYFKAILLKPKFNKKSKVVDIEVFADKNSFFTFDAGAGYYSDKGIGGFANGNFPIINSKGHSGEVDILYTSKQSLARINYKLPVNHDINQFISFEYKYTSVPIKDEKNVDNITQFSYLNTYLLPVKLSINKIVYAAYKKDQDFQESFYKNIFFLELDMQYKSSIADSFPLFASSFRCLMRASIPQNAVFKSAVFRQLSTSMKGIFTLNYLFETRIIGKLKLGYIDSNLDATALPQSIVYYAGGSVLKAHPPFSIGPYKNFFTASCAAQFKLSHDIYLEFFVEAGATEIGKAFLFIVDVGNTLVFKTPIGQLSAGVAWNIRDDIAETKIPSRLIFNIGVEI